MTVTLPAQEMIQVIESDVEKRLEKATLEINVMKDKLDEQRFHAALQLLCTIVNNIVSKMGLCDK